MLKNKEKKDTFGKYKLSLNDLSQYVNDCLLSGYEFDDIFYEFSDVENERIITLIESQDCIIEPEIKESIIWAVNQSLNKKN